MRKHEQIKEENPMCFNLASVQTERRIRERELDWRPRKIEGILNRFPLWKLRKATVVFNEYPQIPHVGVWAVSVTLRYKSYFGIFNSTSLYYNEATEDNTRGREVEMYAKRRLDQICGRI